MSKIAFVANPNGTGVFSIAAPNSNIDRTLTLPDAVGSVVLNEGSGTFKIDSSGNVGIGTSSPATTLEISAGANNTYLRMNDTRSSVPYIGSESGAMVFGHWGVGERARIKADGNVAIGTNAGTSSRLIIGRNGAGGFSTAQLELFSDTGDVILGFHSAGGSATCIDHVRAAAGVRIVSQSRAGFHPIAASAFNVNSDYRIKENIIPLTGAVDRLMQLPVHRFSFVEGSMSYQDGVTVDGFLAHEAQVVVPEAVTGEKDAVDADGNPILQAIDQSKLIPLLTAALQEALADIATLKAEVAALKGVPA